MYKTSCRKCVDDDRFCGVDNARDAPERFVGEAPEAFRWRIVVVTSLWSCGRGVMTPFPPLVEKASCNLRFLELKMRQGGQPDQRLVGGDTG